MSERGQDRELSHGGGKRWASHAMMIAALIGAGIAAYSNSFEGVFLFDDEAEIVNNERIKTIDLAWLLRRNSSRPIVDLSLQINYAMGGLRAWGYHGVNLGIHILAGLTLFGLVRRLGQTRMDGERARRFGFAVAMLWLVHPLNTQAVTYVIQRSESMMGLFYLLTVYCFVRGMEKKTWEGIPAEGGARKDSRSSGKWATAAVVFCAMGMASKGVMVTAPIAVVICDYVFFAERRARGFRVFLYAGLLASWLVLVWLGVAGGLLPGKPSSLATVGLGYEQIKPVEYLRTQAGVILHYMRLVVWPWRLCLDYEWPIAKTFVEYGPQGVAILVLLGLSAWRAIRRSAIGFAGVMFFLVLAPTSSIVPIKDVIFEHRLYLSLAAAICVVLWAGHRILVRLKLERREFAVVAALAVVLGAMTWSRNKAYGSVMAMWSDVLATQPDNARAHNNLGHALYLEKRPAEAIEHFRKAIRGREHARFAGAHYNLGKCLQEVGRMDEAIVYYRQALELAPHEIETAIMLGNALTEKEKLEEAAGVLRDGIAAVDRKTLPLLIARAHFNLGNTLARLGQYGEAETEYRACLAIDPNHPSAHYGLGWVYQNQGRIREAIAEYQRQLSLRADDVQARQALDALRAAHPEAATRP